MKLSVSELLEAKQTERRENTISFFLIATPFVSYISCGAALYLCSVASTKCAILKTKCHKNCLASPKYVYSEAHCARTQLSITVDDKTKTIQALNELPLTKRVLKFRMKKQYAFNLIAF